MMAGPNECVILCALAADSLSHNWPNRSLIFICLQVGTMVYLVKQAPQESSIKMGCALGEMCTNTCNNTFLCERDTFCETTHARNDDDDDNGTARKANYVDMCSTYSTLKICLCGMAKIKTERWQIGCLSSGLTKFYHVFYDVIKNWILSAWSSRRCVDLAWLVFGRGNASVRRNKRAIDQRLNDSFAIDEQACE